MFYRPLEILPNGEIIRVELTLTQPECCRSSLCMLYDANVLALELAIINQKTFNDLPHGVYPIEMTPLTVTSEQMQKFWMSNATVSQVKHIIHEVRILESDLKIMMGVGI